MGDTRTFCTLKSIRGLTRLILDCWRPDISNRHSIHQSWNKCMRQCLVKKVRRHKIKSMKDFEFISKVRLQEELVEVLKIADEQKKLRQDKERSAMGEYKSNNLLDRDPHHPTSCLSCEIM